MLNELKVYRPADDAEANDVAATYDLIQNHPDCFFRSHFTLGHVTGSGLLLSHDRRRVLLNHHKFLNIWIGFGGHADGDADIRAVCHREIIEESGIAHIEPVTINIVDVDVHSIPANPVKAEPAHLHFDIRYFFRVTARDFETFTPSNESVSLRWCTYEEAIHLISPVDIPMKRLLKKWQNLE